MFRLALALGRDIGDIESMPAREFLEWREYESLEPFGAWRDNFNTATIATILANVHRPKGQRPFEISDFMFVDPETAEENEQARKDAELKAFLSRFKVTKKD